MLKAKIYAASPGGAVIGEILSGSAMVLHVEAPSEQAAAALVAGYLSGPLARGAYYSYSPSPTQASE